MKNCVRKMLLLFLIVGGSAPCMVLPGAITEPRSFLVLHESFTLDVLTIYNPVKSQCDADPLITASNKRINTEKLKSGTVHWMALSRNFLKRWGGSIQYGDTVTLNAGDPSIDGRWVIQDTMHRRFHNRGDLLFDSAIRSAGKWTNVTISKRSMLPLTTAF